jgi:hypothetical protein
MLFKHSPVLQKVSEHPVPIGLGLHVEKNLRLSQKENTLCAGVARQAGIDISAIALSTSSNLNDFIILADR